MTDRVVPKSPPPPSPPTALGSSTDERTYQQPTGGRRLILATPPSVVSPAARTKTATVPLQSSKQHTDWTHDDRGIVGDRYSHCQHCRSVFKVGDVENAFSEVSAVFISEYTASVAWYVRITIPIGVQTTPRTTGRFQQEHGKLLSLRILSSLILTNRQAAPNPTRSAALGLPEAGRGL